VDAGRDVRHHPEPTALATLGLLLASAQPPSRRLRYVLAVIPVLSLLVGRGDLMADRRCGRN